MEQDHLDSFFTRQHNSKIVLLNNKIPITKRDGRILIITFTKTYKIDYLLNMFVGKHELFNKDLFKGYVYPQHVILSKTIDPKYVVTLNKKLKYDFEAAKKAGLGSMPYRVTNSIRMLDKSFIQEASQDILNGELIQGSTNFLFDISPFFTMIGQQRAYVDKLAAYEIFKELISTVSNTFDRVLFVMDDIDFNYNAMKIIKKTSTYEDRFKKDLLLDPTFIKDILLFRTNDSKYLIYEDKTSLKRFNKKDKIDPAEYRKFTVKLNMMRKLTETRNEATTSPALDEITKLHKDSTMNKHGMNVVVAKKADKEITDLDDTLTIVHSDKVKIDSKELIKTEKHQRDMFADKPIDEIKIDKLFAYANDEEESKLDDTNEAKSEAKIREKIKREHENVGVIIGNDKVTAKDLREHNAMDIKIKTNDYSNIIPTKAAHTKNMNFAKQYVTSDSYYSDIFRAFDQLSQDKDNPIYITNMEIADKTDTVSSLQEVTYTLKTTINGKEQKRTDRFLIPKVNEHGEFRLNTTRYHIQNTLVPLPITKTKPDEVIVSTLYNKLMIQRIDKGNPKISGLSVNIRRKVGSKELDVVKGKSFEFDKFKAKQSVFLGEMSTIFLRFNAPNYTIVPNRSRLMIDYDAKIKKRSKLIMADLDDKGYIPFGFDKKGNILVVDEEDKVQLYSPTGKSFVNLNIQLESFFANQFGIDIGDIITDLKTYSYARVKIFRNSIPIIFLLGLGYNITDILKKMKVKYKLFNSNNKNIKLNFPSKMAKKIELADGVLYIEDTKPASLLISGLQLVDTKQYRSVDLAKGGALYTDYFYNNLGMYSKGISTLKKFMYMMIDPITADILKDMKIEPNFLAVMCEVLRLLSNNSVNAVNNMNDRRIRPGAELVPSFIYRQLLNVLEKYKDTSNKISLKTFGIKNKAVLEDITSAANVSPLKSANPVNEAEEQCKASYVGPAGGFGDGTMVNKYFREYDESMDKIIGGFSPDSSKVGVDRIISSNPNIKNVRGMVGVKNDDYSNGTELYGLAENIVEFILESDPPRSMMAVKQASHTINVSHAETKYLTTGAEHIMAQETDSKYAFISKKPGRILNIDSSKGIVKLLYDDKTTGTINLNSSIIPQKEDVIYIHCKLDMSPRFNKRGAKFAANEALAYDKQFFKADHRGNPVLALGTYANVAILSLKNCFEDGMVVTSRFADKLDSHFCEQRQLILPPDSSVMKMCNIGDEVEVDTPLVKYSKGSLNDEYAKLFSGMGVGEELEAMTQEADLDGKVLDIDIVYNVPKEELSPSLIKIIDRLEKKKKAIFNSLSDEAKNSNTMLFPKEITGTKYNSTIFDGVMIEFYLEKHVNINVGDKITAVAIKGIICDVIAYGLEPTTSDGRTVDLFISHDSFISRKVSNVIKAGRINNILEKMHKNITDALFSK